MELTRGYKQTEVGIIPNEWDVVSIGDLEPFVTSGSRGWAAFYAEHGSPFIRITNLSRESIDLNMADLKFVNLPTVTAEGIRTQLQVHDVLISITADIGIIGYVSEHVPSPAYINQHIALVRFDPDRVNGKFVSYFLASAGPQKLFRASTDTGAKAGMSLITVQKIRLALPPFPEQHAIAAALSDVDALLSGLERLIAKKRAIKQATMQQLLTGKVRLPGFSGEFKQKTLGDVLLSCFSGATPSRTRPEYFKGDVRWITSSELNYNVITDTVEKVSKEAVRITNLKILPKGTFLMAITGLAACRREGLWDSAGM